MKTNDLVTIGAVASVTATLTVGLFLPGMLDAGDDAATDRIAQPKLVAHGVQFTLMAAEGRTFKAGEEPAFELKATNTNSQTAEVAVRVSMTATSPAEKFSRMPSFPRNFWEVTHSLTLKPNETKVVSLTADAKLPTNSTINVVLQPVDANTITELVNQPKPAIEFRRVNDPSAIVALTYSTLVSTPKPSPTGM